MTKSYLNAIQSKHLSPIRSELLVESDRGWVSAACSVLQFQSLSSQLDSVVFSVASQLPCKRTPKWFYNLGEFVRLLEVWGGKIPYWTIKDKNRNNFKVLIYIKKFLGEHYWSWRFQVFKYNNDNSIFHDNIY